MPRALLLSVLLASCVPTYYVADVHQSGDGLVISKCEFDYHGNPTSICHDEDVGESEVMPTDDTYEGAPDPAELRHVERQLAQKAPPRPAPTDSLLARALTSPGVHAALEACRSAYAPTATTLDVALTVAPNGEIADLSTDAAGRFGTCADRALRTSNLPRFDGTENVHTEQLLAL